MHFIKGLMASLSMLGVLAAPHRAQAPTTAPSLLPATLAARGLPIRSDTMDGYVANKSGRQFYGSYVYAVARTTVAGRAAYLVTMNYRNTGDGFQSDTLALDSATFTPLWRRFHAKEDSIAVTFSARRASGYAVQNRNGNVSRVNVDRTLSDSAWPSGVFRWIAGRLPLAVGYAASMTTFSHWTNQEGTASLSVIRAESLQLGKRTFDTWLVRMSTGAERWIDKATGQIVQERDPASLGGNDAWAIKR